MEVPMTTKLTFPKESLQKLTLATPQAGAGLPGQRNARTPNVPTAPTSLTTNWTIG
jgi:hypothetical protein